MVYSNHNEICSICIGILREKSHLVGINFFLGHPVLAGNAQCLFQSLRKAICTRMPTWNNRINISCYNAINPAEDYPEKHGIIHRCVRELRTRRCVSRFQEHMTKSQISEESWKLLQRISKTVINVYFIIDYSKAFDCVDHTKLWLILIKLGAQEKWKLQ